MTTVLCVAIFLTQWPFVVGTEQTECDSMEGSALLQLDWWNSLEALSVNSAEPTVADMAEMADAPGAQPRSANDDLGLSPQDMRHPLLSLDGALVRHVHAGKGIFHAGITWDSPHWQRDRKLPRGWAIDDVLASAEFFDWMMLGMALLLAVLLRYLCLWQVAGEAQMSSHVASLLTWLVLGSLCATAVTLRFGKENGEEWVAGYLFELFFMLENVFVFRSVIHALCLSNQTLGRVLDCVVFCQIAFEAVFFLGLAHQLRSLHLLPQVLGVGLLFFGLSTLMEQFSKTPSGVTAVLRSISTSSFAGSIETEEEEEVFLRYKDERPVLTVAGTVLLLLLLVDFLCEIDTVLTKIEEIRSPFVAFSSSAMAAFALPELYMLSQDLLFHFPLVKYGIGLILCLLGCQMILAPVVMLQPLLTCTLMLFIIIVFVLISATTGVKSKEGVQEVK
mmetsp:Transcript_42124/g.78299  ORF Transcript_42124/g.78299 Transcript_42124/m.78299 type:complete len:447 (+) Transcript_42124:112-1452(+)